MYQRGTLAEFNIWHTAAKTSAGILSGGTIGMVNGVSAPDNQRTMSYSKAEPHPVNVDDYIWFYGNYPGDGDTILTENQVVSDGWHIEEVS